MSWCYRKQFEKVVGGDYDGEWVCHLVEYHEYEGEAGWTGPIVSGCCMETKEEAEEDLKGSLELMMLAFDKEEIKE